jgi:hypothetical protein
MSVDRYGGSPDEWAAYYLEVEKDAASAVEQEDPVSSQCRRIYFISRSNGRGRRQRPNPREVELIEYGRRVHSTTAKKGPRIDTIAAELLGDTVPGGDQLDEFFRRFRKL